jgi:spore coat protein H
MKTLLFKINIIIITVTITISAQQNDGSWKLYNDSNVARVDITVDPAILEWIYNNVESDSEHYASFHFQNNLINESVDSIGFRLRGNTSRFSQKKSFKISFNTFVPGREFYGVDKLNLNGEHNDPSIIRSKLCFDHFNKIGLTASRANHAEVYINGNYYGLYISVEHIDDEFLRKNFADDSGNLWKCLYPADLQYLGSDPNIYKNLEANGRPVYELKTNEETGDFYKLAHLIDLLNNTPSAALADSIESFLYVPGVLKYFAMNILLGSWDDYWSLMNNYYLYHNPSLDMFYLIPYDYDNTYGIDWFNINWSNADPYDFPKVVSGYRPLAERLIGNSQYRNLYTHFLEFYSSNVYDLNLWRNHIDYLRTMITPYALTDTFRTLDYGFDEQDFFNSYSETGYQNQHVKFGLKQFVNLRNSSLPSQLSYLSADPIVYDIFYEPGYPGPDDSIYVIAAAFSDYGLNEVSIYFTQAGSGTQVYPMYFSPVSNTQIIEETDRWIGLIPPLGASASGEFRIYIEDAQNNSLFYPRKNPIIISTSSPNADNIVINEFMADNDNVIPDPAGEYDDWIELYNPTSDSILLTGKYLTDKPDNLTKWQFYQPDLYLHSGEYLIIWCDEDSGQAGIHTNFALSKNGEFIAITGEDGVTVIDSITFGEQITDTSFGRSPDAGSNWIFMIPTPGAPNIVTHVEDEIIPQTFSLSVFPNPFNPSTTVQYTIPIRNEINFKIYDILGNEVWEYSAGEQNAGTYNFKWNGVNSFGIRVSSGIYLLKLSAGEFTKTIKLMLIK